MNISKNPKLDGTNLIDAIPQIGECPIDCAECFYNGGRFYRMLNEPLLPSPEETDGKIVRVNSGHDSNIDRDNVIDKTSPYCHKFYNTSIPRFDFPGPVVFTCNGHRLHIVDPTPNLMFIRIRVSTWDLMHVDDAVNWYMVKHGVPTVLTFMRYYDREKIQHPNKYEWRKSLLNEYWCPKREAIFEVMDRYKGTGARMCGTPSSSLCRDCLNCELLYWRKMGKL